MTFPPILQEYRFDLAGTLVLCIGSLAWYRRIQLPSRRAMIERIGHWSFAWIAGDVARIAAKEAYYKEIGT